MTREAILSAIPHAVSGVEVPELGPPVRGKVRDAYEVGDHLILITTDRISAFDRVLGLIPFKGQVLNQLSAWWFEQTRDIIQNHLVRVPDANVQTVKKAKALPVEVIVRGYITGSTKTSLWYLYQQGERRPYGIPLPEGLEKNDPLPSPIITPTTKGGPGGHDERLTREEIIERGILPKALWEEIETRALALFSRGQHLAREAGLILVDTKYEFGLIDGELVLIDEIHTPDSSRFWLAEPYEHDKTPVPMDKEFLRTWYADRGYRGDGDPPALPETLAAEVAERYIETYERLTGKTFAPAPEPAHERIQAAVLNEVKRLKEEGRG